MDKHEAELIEQQSVAGITRARKQQDQHNVTAERLADRQLRLTAMNHAVKATKSGGYEVGQIIELAKEFYGFLAEVK